MTEMHVSGPLFDGRAEAAVTAFCKAAETAIAEEGVNMVHAQLHRVLKHPTGYYENHIVSDVSVADTVITDDMVIYGPWLEGVGSRNATTRFKGYATFRLVGQQLNSKAAHVAEGVIAPYLARMT